jgi:hypothetical protein
MKPLAVVILDWLLYPIKRRGTVLYKPLDWIIAMTLVVGNDQVEHRLFRFHTGD